jgi:hypothetical protein
VVQKVTLKVSAMAAAYVRTDAPRDEKLRAARGEVPCRANDLGIILCFLSRDPDPEVKAAALRSLRELSDDIPVAIASFPETHPLVLDMLARFHYGNEKLAELILSHPAVEERTVEFLAEKAMESQADDIAECSEILEPGEDEEGNEDDAAGEEQSEPEDEEHFSKYQLMQQMSIAEKIKMAMIGDKEWRSLLIKDSNKLVSTAVIKNPRITEPEVLAIAKSSELNEEVIRLVCINKDWLKVYPIRKALVENCKTPLPKALRFLATLNEKDILALAKSKNISSTIARQAQRLALNKKK